MESRLFGKNTGGGLRFSISADVRAAQMLLQVTYPKLAKEIWGKTINKATKPLVRQIKSLAPQNTGTFKRNVGVRLRRYKSVDVAIVGGKDAKRVITIGTRKGQPLQVIRNPKNYTHLIEWGRHLKPNLTIVPRRRKALTADFGSVYARVHITRGKAHRLLERSWLYSQDAVMREFSKAHKESIDKSVAKARARLAAGKSI